MSKTAIEVITSVQRRRRWSAAEKEHLVAASLEPGTGVSAIAQPIVWMATASVRTAAADRRFCGGGDCGGAGAERGGYHWQYRGRIREWVASEDHGSG